jgi:Ca-activated chloride channel family protein
MSEHQFSDSPGLTLVATALCPDRPTQLLTLAELTPPEAALRSRPLMDMTLVIDRSSSMAGPRLAAAVEAVRQVGARLGSADLMTVVAFDRQARIVARPAPVTPEWVEDVVRRLTALGVGRLTNIEDGLRQAIFSASRGGLPGAARTVVLVSDGFASTGMQEDEQLVSLAREVHALGLVLHTVGVGERFDEGLLAAMAVAGGGRFAYARHDLDLVEAVQTIVSGEANLVADRAVLRLALGDAVTRYEVVHRLPVHLNEGVLEVTLGRLHLGQPRPVLLKLDLDPAGDEPVVARVAYYRPGAAEGALPAGLLTEPLVIAVGEAREAAAARIGAAWIPLRVARAMEEIWKLGTATSPDEVRAGVEAAVLYARTAPPEFYASAEAVDAVGRLMVIAKEIASGGQVSSHLARRLSSDVTNIFTVGAGVRAGGEVEGWGHWGAGPCRLGDGHTQY